MLDNLSDVLERVSSQESNLKDMFEVEGKVEFSCFSNVVIEDTIRKGMIYQIQDKTRGKFYVGIYK